MIRVDVDHPGRRHLAVRCVEVTSDQFTKATVAVETVVVDAGFTEIDIGSVTVAVTPSDVWADMGWLSSYRREQQRLLVNAGPGPVGDLCEVVLRSAAGG